jgi:hypothetical protein
MRRWGFGGSFEQAGGLEIEKKYKGCVLKGTTIRGKPEVAILEGKDRLGIVDGETLDEAFDFAQAFVDARQSGEAQKRRMPWVGTTEQYIRYFKSNPPRPYEVSMLKANAAEPLTATQIAAAAGYDSYETANNLYGKLGARVGRTIGLEFDRYKNGRDFYMSALVKELGEKELDTGHMRFEMHAELAEALRELGIA